MYDDDWYDCATCESDGLEQYRDTEPWKFLSRRMIVCPDCGNKRCPRATFHDNECTNSNDAGQAGSRYV